MRRVRTANAGPKLNGLLTSDFLDNAFLCFFFFIFIFFLPLHYSPPYGKASFQRVLPLQIILLASLTTPV